MKHAHWITMENPQCSLWKREKYDGGKEQAMKALPRLHGSYLFHKEFLLKKTPVRASLSISGLGYYEVSVNGIRPDPDRMLAPVISNYFQLCRYDTYDITALVNPGQNRILAEICDGWFSPEEKYWGWQYSWHGDARLIAEITVEYSDRTTERICTDETWRWAPGTVISSSIYDGETVDFNRVPGAQDWKTPVLAEAPTENLVAMDMPPVRITRTLKPVKITRFSDREFVYDFGENNAAVACFTVKGKKGDTVVLRHAEFQKEDGSPDYRSQGKALSTDTFTLSDGVCPCQPRFLWHGFRFVHVTLSDPRIRILSAESKVIHSDLRKTGEFTSDNPGLNHLHEVSVRTQLACLLGVPVDCPQRNERKAWLGDAHVTAELCTYNFDMRDFYASLLEDIRLDCERNGSAPFICPGDYNRTTNHDGETTSLDWNIAYPVILSECVKRYGDRELLKKHLPALKLHMAHYEEICREGLQPYGWFGDWCSVDFREGEKRVGFTAGDEENRQNPPFLSTVFYLQSLRLAGEIAALCGDETYEKKMKDLWEKSQQALYTRCYHKATGKFGGGGPFLSAIALSEHLVCPEDEKKVLAELLSSLEKTGYRPLFGIIGMRIVFDVLRDHGYPDIAYRVLTAEGYPSLYDMIGHDRTTFPEEQNGGGSGCHCMFASPDVQVYKLLCGLCIDRTAPVPVTIRPFCPEDVNYVGCRQTLDEGDVSVEWKKTAKTVTYRISVPEGITAQVTLPGKTPIRLTGGDYTFRSPVLAK